jgi:hypothetical protein
MDHNDLVRLSSTLVPSATRRRVAVLLMILGAGTSAGWSPFGAAGVAAKQNRKMKKRRRKRRAQANCRRRCADKMCGPDGCGGECGACSPTEFCASSGVCEPLCLPNCPGKACGPNGCGGSCGTCDPRTVCTSDGRCVIPPL